MKFGENARFGELAHIAAVFGSTIKAGCNLMASRMVSIFAGDGHPIFDESGELLNGGERIVMGDWIWCGTKSTILGDCSLGNQVIIGANSVVSGNHCMDNIALAGNLADVVKHGIKWDYQV